MLTIIIKAALTKTSNIVLTASLLLYFIRYGDAFFQDLKIPKFPSFNIELLNKYNIPGQSPPPIGNPELEQQLISAIRADGRLSNSEEINNLVQALTEQRGVQQPAISPKVYGRWKLIHTTNADTSSPIQRKAVDASKFSIYQDIIVDDSKKQLIVSQVVKFSETAQLKVNALASTSEFPLPELQPRESDGKILGLNILGVSFVGEEASPDPTKPDSRINFVFDEGYFDFNGFQIPYPVPFRWPIFRDAVKGWIDIVYLSDNMRVARGNKGTTFVLIRENAFNDI